ncbi:permease [Archaeoglobus sp.]
MNVATVIINVFAIVSLIVAFVKDRTKTKRALMIALKSFVRILPMVVAIVILIGLLLGFVPKSVISETVGEQAGYKGIIVVAILGAIMHIPSIISFPLASSLLKSGASVTAVAVFITTLTMIGIVTLPLEIRELGKKMALLRNGISFVVAIVIGLIMGKIL